MRWRLRSARGGWYGCRGRESRQLEGRGVVVRVEGEGPGGLVAAGCWVQRGAQGSGSGISPRVHLCRPLRCPSCPRPVSREWRWRPRSTRPTTSPAACRRQHRRCMPHAGAAFWRHCDALPPARGGPIAPHSHPARLHAPILVLHALLIGRRPRLEVFCHLIQPLSGFQQAATRCRAFRCWWMISMQWQHQLLQRCGRRGGVGCGLRAGHGGVPTREFRRSGMTSGGPRGRQ